MITVKDLFIYPVKSLGGFRVNQAMVTDRGLEHDRRWMLVDENHRFLSQRELPQMSMLSTELSAEGIRVFHKHHTDQSLCIPFLSRGLQKKVQVWADSVEAVTVSTEADNWFSRMLQMPCRLVWMPEESRRQVDRKYAEAGEITAFSDGYPILSIFQESLDDLNDRLSISVTMDRFRPNLVLQGASAYTEDRLFKFSIGGVSFKGVKPCGRCVVTTIDQQTGVQGIEPLRTLAAYRKQDHKVNFGMNVIPLNTGLIQIGAPLTITD